MTLSVSWPGRTEANERWLKLDGQSVLVRFSFTAKTKVGFEIRLSNRRDPLPYSEPEVDESEDKKTWTFSSMVELDPFGARLVPQTLRINVRDAKRGLLATEAVEVYSTFGHRVALGAWGLAVVLAVLIGVKAGGLPWRPVAGVATGITTTGLGLYGWSLIKSQLLVRGRAPMPWTGVPLVVALAGLLIACQAWVYRVHNRTGHQVELQGGALLAMTKLDAGAETGWLLFGKPPEALRGAMEGDESVCFGVDCSRKVASAPPDTLWDTPLTVYCEREIALPEAVASDSQHDCTKATFVSYDGGALNQCCSSPTATECCPTGPKQAACAEKVRKAKSSRSSSSPYTVRVRNDQHLSCPLLSAPLTIDNQGSFDVSVVATLGPDMEAETTVASKTARPLPLPAGALTAGVDFRIKRSGAPGQPTRELGTLSCSAREMSGKPQQAPSIVIAPLNESGLLAYRYLDGTSIRSVWAPTQREELERVLAVCARKTTNDEASYEVVLGAGFWTTPEFELPLPFGERAQTTVFLGEARWGQASCRGGATRRVLSPFRVTAAGVLEPQAKLTIGAAAASAGWRQIAPGSEPAWLWACQPDQKWGNDTKLFRDERAVAVWQEQAFVPIKVKIVKCFVPRARAQDNPKISTTRPENTSCGRADSLTGKLEKRLKALNCDMGDIQFCEPTEQP